jgi:putative hemolysin
MATEILIILGLLMANGVFAMTELAVVSSRKVRLKRMAQGGDVKARAALGLVEDPTRFLSTVQVGITLVGILAGAVGGATLAGEVEAMVREVGWLQPYAKSIGIGGVVLAITYVSLVLGELVPKRLALGNPEGIARVMAPGMTRLSRWAGPVVRLLGGSTELALRVIGVKKQAEPRVSEEEVRVLLEEGVQEGVFLKAESEMIESVMALDRLPVREVMTPRPKIIFLSRDDTHEAVWHKIVVSGHSSFPVYDGNRDNVVGMVSVKSVYANLAAGLGVKLADLMTPPEVVPATQTVAQLLEVFRRTGRHVAMVADEFGGMVGMVTLVDVLEAIAGDFPSQEERLRPQAIRRGDGTWLVDALMELSELERALPGLVFPDPHGRGYETVAGFVVAQLGRVPKEGEVVEWSRFKIEVIDMDRHRVDKVLVVPEGSAVGVREGEAGNPQ